MRRRDLLLAGIGVGAFGLSEAFKPRKRLVLLRDGTIADTLPRAFGNWTSEDASLLGPENSGRLAQALYSETVARIYFNEATNFGVMVLVAYGDTQSDLLQLHRPESCYPAVGYAISLTEAASIRISPTGELPVRKVIATLEDRVESIVYWSRLGERLPQSGGQQRAARLQNAMEGYVADGLLFRCSTLGDTARAFDDLSQFVPQLLRSVTKKKLPALIGTRLAQSLL